MNRRDVSIAMVLLGATNVIWAQSGAGKLPSGQDSDTDKKLHRDFDNMVGVGSRLINDAEMQVHLKHYAYAEELCQDAMDVMSAAPFTQAPAKQELAQVYLAEGRYQQALDLWKPMFVPQDPLKEACFGMAVAYARLGEAEKGAEVLRILYKVEHVSCKFLSGGDAPIDKEVTPEAVEATSILMRVHTQPSRFQGEDEADMKRALNLAPNNGPALWMLANYYRSKGDWAKAKPYAAKAYRYGNKLIKEYAAGQFRSEGDHGLDQAIGSGSN